jgi:hypothetical protein
MREKIAGINRNCATRHCRFRDQTLPANTVPFAGFTPLQNGRFTPILDVPGTAITRGRLVRNSYAGKMSEAVKTLLSKRISATSSS